MHCSTCDLQLCLPIQYEDYGDFREAMVMSLLGNDGFGGVSKRWSVTLCRKESCVVTVPVVMDIVMEETLVIV